ncbi:MAG: prepilin-type N-terminal cleavage/methylation domain-containing protein [Planctomycetota bacterium]
MSGSCSPSLEMNCHFDPYNAKVRAFSLVEVLTALAILALISSSVIVVIDRCATSAAESVLRMRAFGVARENMETLLSSLSVEENVEYGESERYPEIGWKTVVETFYEPITARMWVRGVCSAQYNDPNGQEQTIELEHWLTDLTQEQLLAVMSRGDEGQDDLAAELIETLEEAAEYAGVEVEAIEQWLNNGMQTTEDGSFVKSNLDLYTRTNGDPSEEEKKMQIRSEADLKNKAGPGGQGRKDEIDPHTGLTYEELEQMDFSDIWNLMKNRKE